MLNKLRVGIIGLGKISVMHLTSIEALDNATIIACCDIKKELADSVSKKYNAKAYYDYTKMLDNEKLDAVHILLPHYLHTKVAVYALERGINVLSEKPIDIDYESAKNAVDIASKKGLLYGVILQCRYNNSSQLVKKALASGKLGKIMSARSTLTWSRPDEYYSKSDWKGTWDKEGGGVIIDQAIHSIDLVNWLIDSEVESISCSMANRGHGIVAVEDSAEGLITYKNGVKYGFWCMNNYGYDEPIEIKLYCEKGKVTFSYDDAFIEYNDGTTEEAHLGDAIEYEGGKDYLGFQHIRQIKQFYNSCLGLEELEITAFEALKTHKIIMELYDKGGMRK